MNLSALSKIYQYAMKNKAFLFFLVSVLVLIFAILQIGSALDPSADPNKVNQLLSEIEPVRYNEEAISEIRSLRDSNIDIDSNFTDRDNPFVDN